MIGLTAWVQLNTPLRFTEITRSKSAFGHLAGQLALFHLYQLVVPQDAGVVDQDVDPAILLGDFVHPGLDGLPVPDIDLVEGYPGPQFLGGGLASGGIDITDDHLSPFFAETFGSGLADPGSAASDECYFVF